MIHAFTSPPILALDAFRASVADIVGLCREDVENTSRLVADLDCDSFQLVELLALLAELGGVLLLEEDDVWCDVTVADLHRRYCLSVVEPALQPLPVIEERPFPISDG